MSSELIEDGGAIDTGSDEVLLTNGANETDEGVAEYLEEHDPMAPGKQEIPTKRGRKPRRPVETEEVAEENIEALDDDDVAEVIEDVLDDEDEEEVKAVIEKPVLRKPTQLPKKRKMLQLKQIRAETITMWTMTRSPLAQHAKPPEWKIKWMRISVASALARSR